MRKLACLVLFTCFAFSINAQDAGLTLDDNEFKVDKKIVAKVKEVRHPSYETKEKALIGPNNEVLLVLPISSFPVGNPPTHIRYADIFVPALNDKIQIYIDSLAADGVKIGFYAPNEKAWAEYLNRKKLVNADGSLNIENVKALKSRYPIGVVQDYEQKTAFANACAKVINTPTVRSVLIPAAITEVSRTTNGDIVVIKYKVEHEGKVIGEIVGKGNVVNLTNERAEVDFKPKVIYKKSDIEPMGFEIRNPEGCKIATYSPMSKVLVTARGDKGSSHGIMKPVLDGKVETVKTRLEVVSAMVDYLIKLGYY